MVNVVDSAPPVPKVRTARSGRRGSESWIRRVPLVPALVFMFIVTQLPFVLTLAGEGARRALGEDMHLRNGLNVYDGMVTHRAVADALKIKCTPAEAALRL